MAVKIKKEPSEIYVKMADGTKKKVTAVLSDEFLQCQQKYADWDDVDELRDECAKMMYKVRLVSEKLEKVETKHHNEWLRNKELEKELQTLRAKLATVNGLRR